MNWYCQKFYLLFSSELLALQLLEIFLFRNNKVSQQWWWYFKKTFNGRKYQYGNVTCDIYYLSLHFQKINQPLQDNHDTLCLYLAVVNNLDIIIMRLRISYYWSKTKKNNIQHWGLNIGPNRNIGYSPNNEKQTKYTQNTKPVEPTPLRLSKGRLQNWKKKVLNFPS